MKLLRFRQKNNHFDGKQRRSDLAAVAIVCAIKMEIAPFVKMLKKKRDHTVSGYCFLTGNLHGVPVVLTNNFSAGKVLTAIATTLMLEHFQPQAVIFSGVAASLNPELCPGDLLIGENIGYHDLGELTADGIQVWNVWNPVKKEKHSGFMVASPDLLALAQKASENICLKPIHTQSGLRKPQIIKGTILTGDQLITLATKKVELRERFQADAVEMEGAVIADICMQRELPWLIIRGISDDANEDLYEDWKVFLKTAANNTATLTAELIRLWAQENAEV